MAEYKYTFKKFIRDWMLIVAMLAGMGIYLLYHAIPCLHTFGPALELFCKTIQPIALFVMLFLSFCKIEPQQMKPHKWMFWLLLVQTVTFVGLALILICTKNAPGWTGWPTPAVEAGMLCLICPTATACAVVTGKLGGNMAGVVTYTVLINLLVAFIVPLMVPFIHPIEGMTFVSAFCMILAKIFPLLIMPCLCAWIVRYIFPKAHKWLMDRAHWSFYVWAFSLTLAILMSTRAIIHSGSGIAILAGIAAASLLACAFQFWIGKRIGAHYGCKISAGQALGQKNTVFGIWLGYTFLDPVVSVAGGFYSIWHNCFNTWQLYKKRMEKSPSAKSVE